MAVGVLVSLVEVTAPMSPTSQTKIRMKQGDSILYNGKKIRREKNSAFGRPRYTAAHYVRIQDPRVYRSKEEAMAAIDVEARARQIRRRERGANRGFADIGSFIEYRGRRIERVNDASDGTKRYRVPSMGVFRSIDLAVAKIDHAASALERLENPPTVDAGGFKRNLEK
jgi:hypothetical protein